MDSVIELLVTALALLVGAGRLVPLPPALQRVRARELAHLWFRRRNVSATLVSTARLVRVFRPPNRARTTVPTATGFATQRLTHVPAGPIGPALIAP